METNLGTVDWMPALGWLLSVLFWALLVLAVVAEIARDRYERLLDAGDRIHWRGSLV